MAGRYQYEALDFKETGHRCAGVLPPPESGLPLYFLEVQLYPLPCVFANLLAKAGWAVTKEYYINDAGAQVLALAYAAYWRYLQALGTTMDEDRYAQLIPGGLQYRGEYLIPVGQELRDRFGLPHLSMGMTNDFEIGIEEGATIIRLGTVLFEGLK